MVKRARLEKNKENETRPQEVGSEIGRHRLSSPFHSSQLPIYNAQRTKLARWLFKYDLPVSYILHTLTSFIDGQVGQDPQETGDLISLHNQPA